MSSWLEICSAALKKAASVGALEGALVPALYGCPNCGTSRMIASATPLGTCPTCGTQLIVLPPTGG